MFHAIRRFLARMLEPPLTAEERAIRAEYERRERMIRAREQVETLLVCFACYEAELAVHQEANRLRFPTKIDWPKNLLAGLK